MANNKTGFIDLFGPVRAKTENGIVVYPESVAVELDENGNPIKNLAEAIADGSLGGENSLEVIDVEKLPSPTIDTSTAVPSSGMVGKVYFNTKLSVGEVNNILESLEYVSGIFNSPLVAIATNADMSQGIVVARWINEYDNVEYAIDTGDMQRIYQYNPNHIAGERQGWLISEYDLNIENMLSVLASQVGMTIQNDKLKQLISITPFEALNTEIKLKKLYRTPVREGMEWVGTAIPNSGMIEKVYFNTNLIYKNDVKNLLNSSVTWIDAANLGQNGFEFYPILAYMKGSYPYVLAMKKYTIDIDEHLTGDINIALINFATMETIQDFWVDKDGGWLTFENPYTIGFEALTELSGIPIGTQNELIKTIFSITPIITKANTNSEVVGYKYNYIVNGKWNELSSNEGTVTVDIGKGSPIQVNIENGITFIDDVNVYFKQYINDEIFETLFSNKIAYINLHAYAMIAFHRLDAQLLMKKTYVHSIETLKSYAILFELPYVGGVFMTIQITKNINLESGVVNYEITYSSSAS